MSMDQEIKAVQAFLRKAEFPRFAIRAGYGKGLILRKPLYLKD